MKRIHARAKSIAHFRCAASFVGDDGVERASKGGAPTAFRIWRAGENVTDMGVHRFTERSAKALMSSQTQRGNLFSSDVDHLSLSESAPPEARKAVGWFELAVRKDAQGKSELWAVDVQWTAAVKAGLEQDPPEWRYFSPAYDVDKETREIVKFLNLALTNNPATHHVTALASATAKGNTVEEYEKMTLAALLAALEEEKDEDKKAAMSKIARAKFAAAFPDAKDEGDDKKKEEASTTKAADDDHKEPDGDKATKASRTAKAKADAETLTELAETERRVTALEKKNTAAEIERVLATRADLPPKTIERLRKIGDKDLEQMKATLELIPTQTVDRMAAAARAQGTRGAGQVNGGTDGGVDEIRASRLPPEESDDLRSRFGVETKKASVHWEGNKRIFPCISKETARAMLEKSAARDAAKEGVK